MSRRTIFVGFAVEYQEPGSQKWLNLRNRLTFDGGTMPLMFSGSAKFAHRNAVRGKPSRFDGQWDAVAVGDETDGHR